VNPRQNVPDPLGPIPERILRGRRVLVTGAARGIGSAVMQEFRAAGADVVGADIVGKDGLVLCDVRDEESVVAAFDAAAQEGDLTDVVHSAGVGRVGPIQDFSLADWGDVLEVNLTGSFVVAREAARRLRSGGSLTLMSSQAGLRGGAFWSAYSASKFGVVGLAQCVAQELAPRGIRVNAVCPGPVDTPLMDQLLTALAPLKGRSVDELRTTYEEACPLGRLASPLEIGRVCVFLASGLASFVAGSSLVVDGGELTA
jgi:NAD(P)-dependent dehydrogenase (short-subunit alcohol dehydrogenase family)